ncbi:TIGR03885 family FMN-dependent LLM class oxidoreductase [Pseudoxanthomonas sp. LARHCG66]
MALIGYHASHEQFSPADLLAWVARAEQAGFHAAMCSDHLLPWSRAQGQSGHAWTWLGAAMSQTSMPFGVVNAPIGRYHPVVIAQAVATLGCMFGDRFWLGVGSGEALNEHAAGDAWPGKPRRNARLREAVDVMRALWRGECVTHRGSFEVRDAQLFTRPPHMTPVHVAALTAETARWAADWADGLVTIATPTAPVAEILAAFREAGGTGKPIHLQVKVSYAANENLALEGALEQWRCNALPARATEELRTIEDFERVARDIGPREIQGAVHISADPEIHVATLQRYLAMKVDSLYLHNVNRQQAGFIDVFGRHVLPALRR